MSVIIPCAHFGSLLSPFAALAAPLGRRTLSTVLLALIELRRGATERCLSSLTKEKAVLLDLTARKIAGALNHDMSGGCLALSKDNTKTLSCMLPPGFVTSNSTLTVRGPEPEMSVTVPFGTGGFRYTVPDAMGTGRWLEPYVPAPWTKEVVKRARLTLFDGVLSTLSGNARLRKDR